MSFCLLRPFWRPHRYPKRAGGAVLTDGGGHAIFAIDGLSRSGVPLAALSDETKNRLRQLLGEEASVANPIEPNCRWCFTAGYANRKPANHDILRRAGIPVLPSIDWVVTSTKALFERAHWLAGRSAPGGDATPITGRHDVPTGLSAESTARSFLSCSKHRCRESCCRPVGSDLRGKSRL